MKFGQSNGRRGLLKLLASLSPVAVTAALLVAGFALASSGVEEAHATGPITITATANGVSPLPPTVPGPCTPPWHNGDFTVSEGGDPSQPCGDGVNENTAWTFHFNPFLCDPAGQLTSAMLYVTLTPSNGGFPNDLIGVGGLGNIEIPLPGPGLGWSGGPLALSTQSTISRDLVGTTAAHDPHWSSSQILAALASGSIMMGYEDDSAISSATLVLTCTPVPCGAPGGLDISTGTGDINGIIADPIWNSGDNAYVATPMNLEYLGGTSPGWVPAPPGSHWIHASSGTAESHTEPSGPFVYATTFTVPDHVSLALNFQFAADNNVTLRLLGPSGYNQLILPDLSVGNTGSDTNNFHTLHTASPANLSNLTGGGTYTLQATVTNSLTASGLLVAGSITCGPSVGGLVALSVSDSGSPFSSIPLASSAAAALAVLAAGLWYGRRRWLR